MTSKNIVKRKIKWVVSFLPIESGHELTPNFHEFKFAALKLEFKNPLIFSRFTILVGFLKKFQDYVEQADWAVH